MPGKIQTRKTIEQNKTVIAVNDSLSSHSTGHLPFRVAFPLYQTGGWPHQAFDPCRSPRFQGYFSFFGAMDSGLA